MECWHVSSPTKKTFKHFCLRKSCAQSFVQKNSFVCRLLAMGFDNPNKMSIAKRLRSCVVQSRINDVKCLPGALLIHGNPRPQTVAATQHSLINVGWETIWSHAVQPRACTKRLSSLPLLKSFLASWRSMTATKSRKVVNTWFRSQAATSAKKI